MLLVEDDRALVRLAENADRIIECARARGLRLPRASGSLQGRRAAHVTYSLRVST